MAKRGLEKLNSHNPRPQSAPSGWRTKESDRKPEKVDNKGGMGNGRSIGRFNGDGEWGMKMEH